MSRVDVRTGRVWEVLAMAGNEFGIAGFEYVVFLTLWFIYNYNRA